MTRSQMFLYVIGFTLLGGAFGAIPGTWWSVMWWAVGGAGMALVLCAFMGAMLETEEMS